MTAAHLGYLLTAFVIGHLSDAARVDNTDVGHLIVRRGLCALFLETVYDG
jgi:hypothetical protein